MLTDAIVRAAIRDVSTGRKTSATLSDPAPRGAGRLVLMIRPDLAEWYAQRFVRGKRKMQKLGTYPGLSIKAARELQREAKPKPPARATVDALFDAYLDTLRTDGKGCVVKVERLLRHAADVIGPARMAADVTPDDIVRVIRPVFDRGARGQADKYRRYLSAAFRWAIRTTYDYRVPGARDWGVKISPVDAVPRDEQADGVGNRWLDEAEFRRLLAHCLRNSNRDRTRLRKAVALLLLTGQRVREILYLRAEQWDSEQLLLSWDKTKNGLPHCIPVCAEAAEILDSLEPVDGWLFPSERRDAEGRVKSQQDSALRNWLCIYTEDFGGAAFSGRDLRRTWKTLAGEAGLTKDERDWLQNHMHGRLDVSTVHYDRYDKMREKRSAVAKWEKWLRAGSEQLPDAMAPEAEGQMVTG